MHTRYHTTIYDPTPYKTTTYTTTNHHYTFPCKHTRPRHKSTLHLITLLQYNNYTTYITTKLHHTTPAIRRQTTPHPTHPTTTVTTTPYYITITIALHRRTILPHVTPNCSTPHSHNSTTRHILEYQYIAQSTHYHCNTSPTHQPPKRYLNTTHDYQTTNKTYFHPTT